MASKIKTKSTRKPKSKEVVTDEIETLQELTDIIQKLALDSRERPSKVKIFNKVYDIDYISDSKGMQDYGAIYPDAAQVHIKDGQPILDEVDTVFHEVIHGVDMALSLDLTEVQVHNLASGLMTVFQENPKFAQYIIKPRLEKIEGL